MKVIAINGRFLARRQTGQERFAKETVLALDKIAPKGVYELIIPLEYTGTISLKNIKVVFWGKSKSHLWEQKDFAWYVLKNRRLSLNLCTIQPLLAPGVVCIHDISYKLNPQYFSTPYGRKSALWHRLNYFVSSKFSPLIFTVTECSKKEICRTYKVSEKKISVVPNGWEHITRIKADKNISSRFPNIKLEEFFISIGSLAPNKNMKWVFEVAKRNPQKQFVIVGRASLTEYGSDYTNENLHNVIMTGYLSDEELKFLLQHCRALIFPSLYEGFGIPPLEALALGKKAIVAQASCMPEIFHDSVYYIDPQNPDIDIDILMESSVESSKEILMKYRYENAAKIINEKMGKL